MSLCSDAQDLRIGKNRDGQSGETANPGLPVKWPLKRCVRVSVSCVTINK